MDLRGLTDTASFNGELDSEELARATSLRVPRLRDEYVASRYLLRRVLGGELGTSPREVRFARDACRACGGTHGKPILAPPFSRLHFSLSRTSGAVLIGVSDVPVGVDVESLCQPHVAADVADFLHRQERVELSSTAPGERVAATLQLWCRKEAYLKGTGDGLSRQLDLDYVGHRNPGRHPSGWRICDGPRRTGVVSALAVRAREVAWSWAEETLV